MHENDATRLSPDLILANFRSQWSADSTPPWSELLRLARGNARKQLLEAFVLIDLQNRIDQGLAVSLSRYQACFLELVNGQDSVAWLKRVSELVRSSAPATSSLDGAGLEWWEPFEQDCSELPEQFKELIRRNSTANQGQANTHQLREPTLQKDHQAIVPGDQLGDFRIVEQVGEGTHGKVFLASELTLDRMVALKVSQANQQRIGYATNVSEGRMLARLDHAGIVSVYREQIAGRFSLLAMQFVDGQPLSDWLNNNRQLDFFTWASRARIFPAVKVDAASMRPGFSGDDLQVKVGLVRKLAEALRHAHQRGVLHHDVKPANVIVDRLGNPLLSDFNVASIRGREDRGTLGGTVNYMSPEHLRAMDELIDGDWREVDVRSDLYSLGVVFYELLTGTKYWGRQVEHGLPPAQLADLLASRMQSGPPLVAGVPSSLNAIVAKALRPDPNDRYQTASQLIADLQAWQKGEPNVFAADGNWRERSVRWYRRNRAKLIVGTGCFLLCVIGCLVALRWELQRMSSCDLLSAQVVEQLASGNHSGAAELVGQTKAQLAVVQISRYLYPARYAQTRQRLAVASQRVSDLEVERFVSLLGTLRLGNIHQQQPTDEKDLIDRALRSYGVLRHADWQRRPPFADLSPLNQARVAENITELLLVTVSSTDATDEQLASVTSRIPAQHHSLGIVAQVHNSGRVHPPSRRNQVAVTFEAYLYGIFAALEEDYEAAYGWFKHSLAIRDRDEAPRFWTHYWLGYTCQSLGKRDEALVQYGICVGLRPGFAWSPYNMGLVWAEEGEYQLAAESFEQAINLEPDFTAAYAASAAIELKRERYHQALAILDHATNRGLKSDQLSQSRTAALAAVKKLDRTEQATSHGRPLPPVKP